MTSQNPRILVANGVNLDLLGRREPKIYGRAGLAEIESWLRRESGKLAKATGFPGVDLTFFQSNSEAEYLSALDDDYDGALVNPGAWTHTSLPLGDRLAALELPFVEVHLSQLHRREAFRQHSYAAPHAVGVVTGLGVYSYSSGLLGLLSYLAESWGLVEA